MTDIGEPFQRYPLAHLANLLEAAKKRRDWGEATAIAKTIMEKSIKELGEAMSNMIEDVYEQIH